MNANRWAVDFTGALTTAVISEYLWLWDRLQMVTLNQTSRDKFVWKWTADGRCSSSSTYTAFFRGRTELLVASTLWKTKAPGRCLFFIWLVLHRRCWTNDRLRRHGISDHSRCTFSYSKEVWFGVLRFLGLQRHTPVTDDLLADWWLPCRKQVPKLMRKAFDSVVVLTAWFIWKQRNDRIFNHGNVSAAELIQRIADEGRTWALAGIRTIQQQVAPSNRE